MTENAIWKKTFAPFVKALRERFAFIEEMDCYGEPNVSIRDRECSVVYWGDHTKWAHIAVYHDLGSEPKVFIVPLWLQDAKGATLSFGLTEAIAVLDPLYGKSSPHWPDLADKRSTLECVWIDWYAHFLEAYLVKVVNPGPQVLEAIAHRRSEEKI